MHELFRVLMLQCNLYKSDEPTFFIVNVDWVFVRHRVLRDINENMKRSAESILRAIYSYFKKGCRKKCARDNPER